jgi:hypothetical protein
MQEVKRMVAYLSLIVAIIGLIMYFVASNPKVQRVGEILLFTGTLAFFLIVGSRMVDILR